MHLAIPFIPSLLAKELIELAAARRTYVLRSVYAIGLFAIFLSTSYRHLAALQSGDMSMLGSGGKLFDNLMILQFCGIYLFMPLLVAPLICEEDERGSLDLLLVSGISQLEFLLQKLISRLIGMGSFLLLALPIGGIAYALGGVSDTQLMAGAISLMFCCLQISCVVLWCGTRAHTSMKAVTSAYLLGPVMLFFVAPLVVYLPIFFLSLALSLDWFNIWHIIPMSLYYNTQELSLKNQPLGFWAILLSGLPILLSAIGFFLLAWRQMLRRHTVVSPLMRQQMKIYRPGIQFELHRRQRVVALGADMESLPSNNPLSWREIRRTPVFRKEHRRQLLFGLSAIITMTLILSLSNSGYRPSRDGGKFTLFQHWVYVAAIPLIAIVTAGLISGERKRNSLEILLITPLTGREIITEKLAGCNRLIWMSLTMVAFFSVLNLLQAFFEPISWLRLAIQMMTAWIYLQITVWLAMAVSLRMRLQTQATVTILGIIGAWIALPLIAIQLYSDISRDYFTEGYWPLLTFLSPVSAVFDIGTSDTLMPWLYRMLLNMLFYGAVLWLIRRHCLKHADVLLGRAH